MVSEEPFTPSLDTRPFGTPLRRFQAVLQDYVSEKRKDSTSNREYMTIQFNFVDLVVLESMEPYPHPIAVISIGYSTTQATRWDVLASSIKTLWGETPALDALTGKRQEWAYLPCKLRTRLESGEWTDVPNEAWQVVGVEGVGAGVGAGGGAGSASAAPAMDATEHLIANLLDGKNDADFHQALYQDQVMRGHPDIISSATERKLLPALETAGRVWRDPQGIWHKGPNPDGQAVAATPPATGTAP